MQEKFDIVTEENIGILVDKFYSTIFNNKDHEDLGQRELSRVFREKVGQDFKEWDEHLALIRRFWQTIMLGDRLYSNNLVRKHIELHNEIPFEREVFQSWVGLFFETVRSIYTEDIFRIYEMRTRAIASSLMVNLYERKPKVVKRNNTLDKMRKYLDDKESF